MARRNMGLSRCPFRVGGLSLLLLPFCASVAQANLTISSKPTQNMSCSAGVCSPTAKKAVLNATDLANMLAASDVKVVTDSHAKDISVEASFGWVSANRLTLDSWRSIAFNKGVTIAGSGALTIITNDGGAGGDFHFEKKGHVEFWDLTSSLLINGQGYVLAKSVHSLSRLIKHNRTGFFALAKSYNAARDGTYSSAAVPGLFEGTFEGLGNTISNLTVNSFETTKNIALFEELGGAGSKTIRDIGLLSVSVTGTGSSQCVAALVGTNSGTVRNSYSTGQVFASGGDSFAGGLVCFNDTGTIRTSYSSVTVDGTGNIVVGGLVGESQGFCGGSCFGLIDQSYATGPVSGGNSANAGGLAGANLGGIVSNSYATGGTTGGANALVGGLIGGNADSSDASPNLASSYSIGAVSGGQNALVGGLIGRDVGTGEITNAYWDMDTSGINDPSQGAGNVANDPGITGLSDTQLKSSLPSGFDLSLWGQSLSINNGYPYLLALPLG